MVTGFDRIENPPDWAQLREWFQDNRYTHSRVAWKLGYSYDHVCAILTGRQALTSKFRFAVMDAFPETATFLLPAGVRQRYTLVRKGG